MINLQGFSQFMTRLDFKVKRDVIIAIAGAWIFYYCYKESLRSPEITLMLFFPGLFFLHFAIASFCGLTDAGLSVLDTRWGDRMSYRAVRYVLRIFLRVLPIIPAFIIAYTFRGGGSQSSSTSSDGLDLTGGGNPDNVGYSTDLDLTSNDDFGKQ